MALAEIPYGSYWSTPFVKWQGSLQHLHSLKFAASVTAQELARRNIDKATIDFGVLGMTVPQHQSFYGAPWFLGLAGLKRITGPTVSQACATGVRCLLTATQEIASGYASAVLTVTADRCSNGPHIYYPAPSGPGGTGAHEDWVLDNFSCDPFGNHSMIQTAENVAAKHGISLAEQHEVVLRRSDQYGDALAEGRAFQRRYIHLPFEVPDAEFRKSIAILDGDEGVRLSTKEGLGALRPVLPDGTVTFGSQTYPADGNCGMIVCKPGMSGAFSSDPSIKVRILGFGQARAELAFMPEAIVPAARMALENAGLGIDKMDALKSHNPFAVNDIYFARQVGVDVMAMNNFGCSLVWGHPQGPTGTRALIELIEELAVRGGGYGLFQGCAAGDSAMAVVLRVGD